MIGVETPVMEFEHGAGDFRICIHPVAMSGCCEQHTNPGSTGTLVHGPGKARWPWAISGNAIGCVECRGIGFFSKVAHSQDSFETASRSLAPSPKHSVSSPGLGEKAKIFLLISFRNGN